MKKTGNSNQNPPPGTPGRPVAGPGHVPLAVLAYANREKQRQSERPAVEHRLRAEYPIRQNDRPTD